MQKIPVPKKSLYNIHQNESSVYPSLYVYYDNYEGKGGSGKKKKGTEFERILLSTGKKSLVSCMRGNMQRDESLRWRARSESIMPRRGRWVHDSTESSMGEERSSNNNNNNTNNSRKRGGGGGEKGRGEEGEGKNKKEEKEREIVGKKPRWWFLGPPREDTNRGNKGQSYLVHASKPEHEST